ncbi:MAG: NAD(P)H-hydrate epimerase [Planctomycetaceae bacterium]|nr:NAD(P)H-hydrate epimerase [Planctomycetaceae bacterium]
MSDLYLTRVQSREIDATAIHEYGIPGIVLMENAGRGAVDALVDYGIYGHILICCGKGNNAGDGFVMARHLTLRGHLATLWLFAPPDELTGDAAANYRIAKNCAIPMVEFQNGEWGRFETLLHRSDWVVDALLGTGAQGAPREPFAGAIRRINRACKKVLAVDLPSGLDADTGLPADPTIRATLTCTFFANKFGLAKSAAMPYVGEIDVCDIGFPPSLARQQHR